MTARQATRVPTRRNVELALLLLVILVLFVFQTAVEIALLGELTQTAFWLVGLMGAAMLVAHVLVRIFAPYADPVLLPCGAMLTGIGVVFIRRLDMSAVVFSEEAQALVQVYPTVEDRAALGLFDDPGGRQLMYLFAAVAVFAAFLWLVRDHRNLSRYPFILGLTGILMAASPAIIGQEINGSKLWIDLGFASVQPSEFAKLLLLIFFAYYLVRKREVLSLASRKFLGIPFPRAKDLIPVLVVWLVSLLIMIGIRDLGTSLLFFGLFVAMLYIATERISWIIIGLSLFTGGVLLIYPFFSHLQLRVSIWLDPFADPNGDGRQLVQSLIGLGSGGLFGAGPGAGQPQATNPAANSDFILSGLGEELGLFGLTAILMVYLLLVARGMRAGLGVRDSFGKLVAGGLAFSVGFQLFVVLGGVTKLIPLTGQTAPYMAAGGSSLLANWVLLAMLVRLSDAGRRPQAAPAGPIKIAPPPAPVDDSPTQIVSVPQLAKEPGTGSDPGSDGPPTDPYRTSPSTTPEVKP
ncbi:cell elongation-specific peptidoglycan biosynthesis regulator RodA [Stackebrandtia albiflava]|uniref:Cell elongation-specific peptidoglycan biosynthesis regulator RodA n=1 Tax=Stackebrandtia albiflava TaxID=406432 RepID=A0A562V0T2_9ACTN|nr:FtsW/RodA/SpoVE family cell cycle protein [Stackebrandtia albiflava]TWJ11526.1 cell elongation-specific peptidoglycan biosynthesis regulator RodA [Stackebrandtia albiflava]